MSRRTSGKTTGQARQLQLARHESFFFSDGNLSVIPSDNTVFKISEGHFIKHSKVFEDLAKTGKGRTVDGVPSLKLDDTAADLTNLFRHLWNPIGDTLSFDEYCSLLRMGAKYEIEKVKTWALARMTAYLSCPTPDALSTNTFAFEHFNQHPSHAGQLVSLARSVDVPSLLPLALYWLAVNGHRDVLPQESPFWGYGDVAKLMALAHEIRMIWWDYVRVLNEPLETGKRFSANCFTPGRCVVGFKGPVEPEVTARKRGEADPLAYFLDENFDEKRCCVVCAMEHKKLCKTFADVVFRAVLAKFGLTSN